MDWYLNTKEFILAQPVYTQKLTPNEISKYLATSKTSNYRGMLDGDSQVLARVCYLQCLAMKVVARRSGCLLFFAWRYADNATFAGVETHLPLGFPCF